jgi:cytochrome c oxidase subunit IV
MVSHEEGIKVVKKGFVLLGCITIVEVMIALLGNGHIIEGFHLPKLIMYPAMIAFSIYKAYYIVFNFMHMAYEVKGMAMSVVLPMGLLVWAVVAFFNEGSAWGARREFVQKRNRIVVPATKPMESSQTKPINVN